MFTCYYIGSKINIVSAIIDGQMEERGGEFEGYQG